MLSWLLISRERRKSFTIMALVCTLTGVTCTHGKHESLCLAPMTDSQRLALRRIGCRRSIALNITTGRTHRDSVLWSKLKLIWYSNTRQ
jgi:hypothetical protein